LSSLIASLDNALAGYGEDVTLIRYFGAAPNQADVRVVCRARVDAMSAEQIVAGVNATDLSVIFSPSEINANQWPGGHVPPQPPFEFDQRIPRAGGSDRMIVRGVMRQISFVDPKIVGGELVRINIRVAG
jgi:hypothetical protein